MGSDLPRVVVYIEPELLEKVKKMAKKERRSVSSLIVYLLENEVQTYELEKGNLD